MKYHYNTTIDEVSIEDLKELTLMTGIDPEDLVSLRDEYADNEKGYRDELVSYIVDTARENGFDDDEPLYNSLYWFFKGAQTNAEREADANEFIDGLMSMGYQPEIKHIGILHAPKLLQSPVRYIDTDERRNQRVDDEFFNDLRSHSITQHDPLTKLVRNMILPDLY